MTESEKAIEYYRAGVENRAPQFVPCRIRLKSQVRGDFPIGHRTIAEAGEHDCHSNRWGAVSVIATNGQRLGIRPTEFDPVAWRENSATAPTTPSSSPAPQDTLPGDTRP